VVNLVLGYGHTAGAALAAHPDVDKVAFTGSTEVGKLIVQAASGNLKKVSLELGGKSPVLIFDDAAMRSAIVSAAMGIFSGSGQGCVCGSRIFVQRGVFDQVVEGIAAVGDHLNRGATHTVLREQLQRDRQHAIARWANPLGPLNRHEPDAPTDRA
jgi:aldehyde dehydrogenase (NAD+)